MRGFAFINKISKIVWENRIAKQKIVIVCFSTITVQIA